MSRLIDADAFEAELNERVLPILIERYGRDEALRGLHFSFRDVICNIQGQPTIEQRKTGKWIKNSNGTYSCDKCHSWIPNEQHYYANFCLYCGADMRGEQDGKST